MNKEKYETRITDDDKWCMNRQVKTVKAMNKDRENKVIKIGTVSVQGINAEGKLKHLGEVLKIYIEWIL